MNCSKIYEINLLGSSAVQAANIEQAADSCLVKVRLSLRVIAGCMSRYMCLPGLQVQVVALLSNAPLLDRTGTGGCLVCLKAYVRPSQRGLPPIVIHNVSNTVCTAINWAPHQGVVVAL